jgi:hypothetical protein
MDMFTKMVENNTITVQNFEKYNVLLEKIHHQMDWLINKLWVHETYYKLESNGVVGKKYFTFLLQFFS